MAFALVPPWIVYPLLPSTQYPVPNWFGALPGIGHAHWMCFL